MNYYESMRAVILSPESSENEREEAEASLKRMSEAGNERAESILSELGLLESLSADTSHIMAASKQTVNDPSSTAEQKAAAWQKLNDPAAALDQDLRKLEVDLLAEYGKRTLAEVSFPDVWKFLNDRHWDKTAMEFYESRWFPAYSTTPDGFSRNLRALLFMAMNDEDKTRAGSASYEYQDETVKEAAKALWLRWRFVGTEPAVWDWFDAKLEDRDKELLGFNTIPRPEKSKCFGAPRFLTELMRRKTADPAWYKTLPLDVRENAETIARLSSLIA